MPYDPTSQSNLDQVKTAHIHINLGVDFAAKILSGSAELDIEAIADKVSTLILDTSFIDIKSVSANGTSLKVRKAKKPCTPDRAAGYAAVVVVIPILTRKCEKTRTDPCFRPSLYSRPVLTLLCRNGLH